MRLLFAAALLFSACSDDGDDSPDTGVVDTGPGADGCFDTPPQGDTGVIMAACDPGDGTGCDVSTGRFCVWSFEEDQGRCRCLGDAPNGLGGNCSMSLQDCGPGLNCLNIEGNPMCYQVCTQDNPVECDALSSAETTFLCFPIVRGDQTVTQNFGLCVGRASCNPLDDRCAADQTCTLITGSSNACLQSGPIPIGGDCSMDFCMKGGVCVPLTDQNGNPLGTNCYEPCDLSTLECSAGACMDVGIAGFGLCL